MPDPTAPTPAAQAAQAVAQPPVAGGDPAPNLDAPPALPSSPNVSTIDQNGSIAMPHQAAKVVTTNAEPPLVHRDDAEFLVLHHRVGSGAHFRRRGEHVRREDFGPDADIEFMISKGAIVPIGRKEPETPADPLRPPATTDPDKGLPRGGVKPK
ncbi:MAG: hypothetical protein P4L84_11095 [Isosphaeraceae bacterium]|nr:hypothetical protein [Isosphaeraceae bacterium]